MPVWRRLGVGLFVAVVATLSGGWVVTAASTAAAQTGGCTNGGSLGAPQITIDSPAPNDSVSGTVTVRGTARLGLLGQLDRVEVTLGGVTKAQTFDPGSVLNFSVPVDASSLPSGTTSLRVVACGGFAYGEKSITVNVAAPAATTTAPRVTTTTAAGTGGSGGPGTTVAGATTTSVGASGAGAGAGGQAGSTTSTKVSTTTTTAAPTTTEVATTVATTTTVRGGNTPLVLTETPTKSKSGAPVWVGAVVGISGGLGLLFSARPWRRRGGGPGGGGDGGADAEVENPTEQLVR